MKFAVMKQELPIVDSTPRQGTRQKDTSPKSDRFDDTLAGVRADQDPKPTGAPQKADAPPAADDPGTKAAPTKPDLGTAIAALLTQAQPVKSAPDASGAKQPAKDARDPEAPPEDPNTSLVPTTTNPDLFAMMLASGLVKATPAPTAAAPVPAKAATTATPTPAAPAGPAGPAGPATTPSVAVAAADPAAAESDDTPEVILGKPVIETHLAPSVAAPVVASAAAPATTSATPTPPVKSGPHPDASQSLAGMMKSASAEADTGGTSSGSGRGESGQDLASSTAAALQQVTTHHLTSAQAAIRSIVAAVSDLASQPAATTVNVPDATASAPVAPARTMTLQMSPPDLGTVDIRLHVTGDALDVQLKLSNAETLGMVHRDREALTAALQDQNYKLNSLIIQDGGAPTSSGGQNAATPGGGSAPQSRSDQDSGRNLQGNGQNGGQRSSAGDQFGGDARRQPGTSSDDTRRRGLFI